MYRYKKRLWTCEVCGAKTEILGLRDDGKHVCGKCSYLKPDEILCKESKIKLEGE